MIKMITKPLLWLKNQRDREYTELSACMHENLFDWKLILGWKFKEIEWLWFSLLCVCVCVLKTEVLLGLIEGITLCVSDMDEDN